MSLPTEPQPSAPGFGPPSAPGEIGALGPYRIQKELGRGGMGAVYLALDTRLNRRVALKVILPEFAANPAARERFLREARTAALLAHDNVVSVHEVDERDGIPYIALQFLHGSSLADRLKQGGLPLSEAVRVGRETALGLAAAHAMGVIHRDIKPANLWIEAPSGRVKILDFGLARPTAESDLTHSGAILGTPAYLSPEQAGAKKVDHRTDLFSLGAVLYQLCTGRKPFDAPTPMAVLMALGTMEPAPIRNQNPNVPEPLAALVHQLLAKNPDNRPQSANEVADRLRAIEQQLADGGTVPLAVPVVAPAYSQSQPQVIYVPVPEQPNTSAFADLDASDSASSSAVDHSPTEKPAPRRSFGKAALAAVGAGLVVAAVVVVFIATSGKDKPEAKAEAPTAPPVDGKKGTKPPPPPPPVKPDRKAAEYVLSLGGRVRINGTVTDHITETRPPTDSERLTGVSLAGNARVTDAGLAVFRDCKDVWTLQLQGTAVSDAGLAHFAGCRDLNAVYLEGTKITDAGPALIPNRERLVVLFLGQTAITDAGMVHLRDCRSLQMLNLAFTGVTDAGLAHFNGSTNVWMLYLQKTKTTDAGLARFKSCLRMEYLDLRDTQVSDTSIEQIKSYTELTTLDVRTTKVTPEGVEQLAKALPGCRIYHTDGVIEPKKK